MITEGAAIYEKPDFDSPVIFYLEYGKKIAISRKPVMGAGGLGLFHHVRLKDQVGYITDTDVRVNRKEVEKKSPEEKQESKAWEKEEREVLGKEPLYFTRHLGGALAYVNMTEKFDGRKLSDYMTFYGLRMTGPGTLVDGPPLDFNLWFTVEKPSYYSQFSSGSPSGFMIFSDIMALLPLYDHKNTLVTYGLGLLMIYSRYKIPVRSVNFDSEEFRIGVDLGLGVGQRIAKHYIIRLDSKYYIERTQYFGFIGSFQVEY